MNVYGQALSGTKRQANSKSRSDGAQPGESLGADKMKREPTLRLLINCVFLIGGFWGFLGLTQIPVSL